LGIHQRDGIFAEYVALPLANLFEVPENVPDEAAVFTEPLAAALRIREQVRLRPSAQTAVIGPGRLGLLVGQVLALAGTAVLMLGRTPESLELPVQLGLQTALAHDLPDDSFDLVVEATGNEAGFAQALRLVRPLGTIILKSTYAARSQLDLTKIVVSEINLVGSRCGPFAPALRLLAANAINTQLLINAEFPLAEGLAAFAVARQPGVRKVLIRPSGK
jgi:threonine dehydrogenase-like Zn-dependent dehydrogenase